MPRWSAIGLAAALTTTLAIGGGRAQPVHPQDNFAGTVGPIEAQQFQSGSEAYRAASCGGDYVCDEDGSWAIGDISPTNPMTQSSLQAIERIIRNGKVASPATVVPRAQLAKE